MNPTFEPLQKTYLTFELLIGVYFSIQILFSTQISAALAINGFIILSILKYKKEGFRINYFALAVAQLLLVASHSTLMDATATALAFAAIYFFPMYQLPKPSGKFLVGARQANIEGDDITVFYPTTVKTNDILHAPHESVGDRLADIFKYFTDKIPGWAIKLFTSNATKRKMGVEHEAPIPDGHYPFIIFSHGLAAHKHMYSYLCKEWASQGMIVFSIDFPEKVFLMCKDYEEFVELRKPQLEARKNSVIKTLDFALKTKNIQELLQNDNIVLDASKVMLAGHSFGGACSLEVAAQDSRINGGVMILDPWLDPCHERIYEKVPLSIPTLSLRSDQFDSKVERGKNARRWARFNKEVNGDRHISGYVKDAGHNVFSDMVLSACREMTFDGNLRSIDQVHDITYSISRFTSCFVDQVLKTDTESLKKMNFETEVLKSFYADVLPKGMDNYVILDTLSNLSAY